MMNMKFTMIAPIMLLALSCQPHRSLGSSSAAEDSVPPSVTRTKAGAIVDAFFEELRTTGKANLKHAMSCDVLCAPDIWNCAAIPAANCAIRIWADVENGPWINGVTIIPDMVMVVTIYYTLETAGNVLESCSLERMNCFVRLPAMEATARAVDACGLTTDGLLVVLAWSESKVGLVWRVLSQEDAETTQKVLADVDVSGVAKPDCHVPARG